MINILKPDFLHRDSRGSLVQLVHCGYNQVNVINSVKGTCRGGHYHKNNTEVFYVIYGQIELFLEKEDIKKTYCFKDGDMFEIEPFVLHTFNFIDDTLLVSLYSNGVELENGKKDIYSE
jgi:dTDP-4-dehydrorhamnose 3,5-epimerase-like enzyme